MSLREVVTAIISMIALKNHLSPPRTLRLVRMLNLVIVCLSCFVFQSTLAATQNQGCKYFRNEEKAMLGYHELCMAEYESCKEEYTKKKTEEEFEMRNVCEKPLSLDPRYKGPCPSVMLSVEAMHNPSDDLVLARALLRKDFYRMSEQGKFVTYREDDSIKEIRELLSVDKENYTLNSYLKFSFDDEETVEPLRVELKILELDPDCRRHWFFYISAITRLVVQLVEKHASNSLTEGSVSDTEVADLVTRAWDALRSLYEAAYESSVNVSKVSYALQATRHPFLMNDESVVTRLEDILDIDSDTYQLERLRFFARDLSNQYSKDSIHGRLKSLGMMCRKM